MDSYEWGCEGELLFDGNGGASSGIFSGYENTLNIVNECLESPTAASAALDFSTELYDDWYLPSIEELELFYDMIDEFDVPLSYANPLGLSNEEFEWSNWFWSSTEVGANEVIGMNLVTGYTDSGGAEFGGKNWSAKVLPVRAFGNWTMGCMDSLACNYNPEANMADGSCEYAELGYNCDGNFVEIVVGMEAEGGIVFYIDETGEHGLVADILDLGVMNWNDAMYTSETSTSGGYDDWYLPSKGQLLTMRNTIGIAGPDGDIGGL